MPKAMAGVETLTCGTTPVPVSVTVWGFPEELSEMQSVAMRAFATAGVKTTLIRHDVFWARDAGQLLVWLNSVAFAPLIEIELMASGPEPVLVTVTGCEAPGASRF